MTDLIIRANKDEAVAEEELETEPEETEAAAGEVDYKKRILHLLDVVDNQDVLKRVYKLFAYLYVHKS